MCVTIDVIVSPWHLSPEFEHSMLCSAPKSLQAKLHGDSQNEMYISKFQNLNDTSNYMGKKNG